MNRLILLLLVVLTLAGADLAQAQVYLSKEPLAHTFSIVARDPKTGEMAVGVQSHWFSVGSIVSWGKSGIGVVATQSFVNPAYGPKGLAMLERGSSAKEALAVLLEEDEGREVRQVAILDSRGEVAVHTGKSCIQAASHQVGDNFSVQANMMLNTDVVPEMRRAFEESEGMPLAERVLEAMTAAQTAGGDIRGQQSAVLLVVGGQGVENEWEDKLIDLRVDDHPNPVEELGRLLRVHRAYEHMNNGDLAVEKGNMKLALQEYGAAEAMFPKNLEMKYWKAVAMTNNGQVDEAMPIFKLIFDEDPNWKELTRRLPASGLLLIEPELVEQILAL